jgi:hypothetical protein
MEQKVHMEVAILFAVLLYHVKTLMQRISGTAVVYLLMKHIGFNKAYFRCRFLYDFTVCALK